MIYIEFIRTVGHVITPPIIQCGVADDLPTDIRRHVVLKKYADSVTNASVHLEEFKNKYSLNSLETLNDTFQPGMCPIILLSCQDTFLQDSLVTLNHSLLYNISSVLRTQCLKRSYL